MDSSNPIQLNLEILASDATVEDIDRMTRQLLSELKELDVESVELTKGEPAPEGSKGDALTIGSIVIEVLPAFYRASLVWCRHGSHGDRGAP